ncbi:DUF5977 domain-containing protein [Pedobacter nototheniae]|uniref:DUF5977 domain-containing protein n=1 Tax=Pedobacter nototheniae TaxID=2488994 RepID=UPI00103DF575|nr:DUF5977 domain-containing protein [Pedobacter nototheniae]
MIRSRKYIAAFLLLVILSQVSAPTVAFALTSGPTAPEATSFEPVDTTDMVNPLTGDFTYNTPLMEVPGPEGGYPLSLSYHAGIQPNEEASWVGLGWTLNPGAIARNVNGYPDDFKDVNNTIRSYWSGGTTKTVGVDVGIGLGPVSVNFGLEFSQDTYKGFGIGASIGGGFGWYLNSNVGIGVGATVGTSAFGENYAGITGGLSIGKAGTEGIKLGIGVSVNTNFKDVNVGANAGISYSDGNKFSASLLGASISSSGGGVSISAGGGTSSVNSANSGKIQTESSGWSFTIPLPIVSIGISSNYMRYWSDETDNVLTNGSLYAPVIPGDLNNTAYDTYRLLNPNRANIVDNPDPDRLIGGSYPDFDNYSVTAQGLSGNMRPYAYQAVVYKQNTINNDHNNDITARVISSNKQNPTSYGFRFENDFSNSYRQNANAITASNFDFANPKYGNNDGDYGYDNTQNKLAGSKSIQYFTNEQINSSYAKEHGFCNYVRGGYMRNADPLLDKQIGGFMITNASGVTYHYALPAYSGGEQVYTEKISRSEGHTFNNLKKPTKYAYTWFLTAITGPDYVDRNNDGIVNKDDWGYWVKFDYGKWSSYYSWRNPSEGFHKDIDSEFQSVSSGIKDVYYLNTIRTRSHVAVFEKSNRADAKSISEDGLWNNQGDIPMDNVSTVSSLKLSRVYLLKSDDFDALNKSVFYLNNLDLTLDGVASKNYVDNMYLGVSNLLQSKNNVIDDKDILKVYDTFKDKCIRSIRFNYDYSLCNGVPNSYDPNGDRYASQQINTLNYPRIGKLTLLSIENLGRNETSIEPPTEFEYDLDPTLPENSDNIQIINNGSLKQILCSSPDKFEKGDIIKFNFNGRDYYCVFLSRSSNLYTVQYLNATPDVTASGSITAIKTKNPPYNKDAVDIWGMYKSDYNGSTGNENLDRMTTPVSNAAADVWCLRKIKSQLGADINITYEGDDYTKSTLNKSKALIITDFDNESQRAQRSIVCTVVYPNTDIKDYLKEGDKVSLVLLKKELEIQNGRLNTKYSIINSNNYGDQIVTSVNGTRLTIKYTDALYNEIIRKTSRWVYADDNGNTMGLGRIKAGNIGVSNRIDKYYGGGIRVRQIEIDALDGNIKRTKYTYTLPQVNSQSASLSSGATAYEPNLFDIDNVRSWLVNHPPFPDNPNLYVPDSREQINETVKSFRRELYQGMNYLLGIARELPSPGIMYEYVTINDENVTPDGAVTSVAGKTTYQYEVFKDNMIGKKEYSYEESSNTRVINMSLKNYTSRIGNLKRTISYDNNGNKLTEIINHYLHDPIGDDSFETQASNYDLSLLRFNYQGVIQERYGDARTIMENGTPIYKTIMSGRDFYPAIQTGTTQIDYKNGTKIKQENLAFDFYNGLISKTLTTDSYGNRFVNEITPAYRIYAGMGLKISEPINGVRKNMLVQQASSKTTKIGSDNQLLGIVSASAQTWSNDIQVLDPIGLTTTYGQKNIWRKKASYNWLPEGTSVDNLTNPGSFQDYFSGGANNPNWKKTADIKLYNVYSGALEATDINNKYAATKMGYSNSKVTLSGAPARYNEIAFSGAEDMYIKTQDQYIQTGDGEFEGGVRVGNALVTSATAHTGTQSLSLTQLGKGFIYSVLIDKLDPDRRNYIISAWVKPSNGDISEARLFYQIDNGLEVLNRPNFQKQAAGWYLLEMTIPAASITSGILTVGVMNAGRNMFYADDFRFQPLDAVTTAYVYDNKNGQLTHILNNNNLFIKYEYDNVGRLIRTYKEVLGKPNVPLIKEYNYNYAKPIKNNVLTYYNKEQSKGFRKNNCYENTSYEPEEVIYTVPANKYVSSISQADADQKAYNDLATNGQAHANELGGCGSIYWNKAQLSLFQKNDCTASDQVIPTWITLSVPADKYWATSQKKADDRARVDMSQDEANSLTTCLDKNTMLQGEVYINNSLSTSYNDIIIDGIPCQYATGKTQKAITLEPGKHLFKFNLFAGIRSLPIKYKINGVEVKSDPKDNFIEMGIKVDEPLFILIYTEKTTY